MRTLGVDPGELRSIVDELQIERIVIGYPVNMNGSEGPQARRAKRLAERVREQIPVPIVLCDERLSTKIALDIRRTTGKRRGRKQDRIDAVAAAVILQSYLDCERAK